MSYTATEAREDAWAAKPINSASLKHGEPPAFRVLSPSDHNQCGIVGAAPRSSTTAVPDTLDDAILSFELRWLPYGGAPLEDTLVDFGLTPTDYLKRVLTLIYRHSRRIRPETQARIATACERRLREHDSLRPAAEASGA